MGADDDTPATDQATHALNTRDTERRAGFIMEMRARGVRSRDVLSALERVPRHLFVAREFAEFALADRSLPIACGQMIERPSIAARMVEALDISKAHKILEIGTGSGWLTAVLAALAAQVISVERYRTLAKIARGHLGAHGVGNATVLVRDGLAGDKEHAPFDRILVGGSLDEIPRPLFEQLRPDGAIIAAVGPPHTVQRMLVFRQGRGHPATIDLGEVRFVPLTPGLAAAI